MAVGYNLISCDDILYPSLFQRDRTALSANLGQIVEFGTNEQYYTVERNNQVFIPYPYEPDDYTDISVSITSLSVNGNELITTPLSFTYTSAAYPKTSFQAVAANPTVFPTDYPAGQNTSTVYVPGTTSPKALPDFIQAILGANGIQNIFFVASHPDSTIRVASRIDVFTNYMIHKPEASSVTVEYTTTLTPAVGADIVDDHVVTFTGTTATYQVNGITVNPVLTTTVQDFITTGKPVYLYAAPTEEITVQEECPCESCGECFNLTNCETGEIMQTTTDLTEYLSSVIKLEGYDGCWTVSNCLPKVPVVVEDEFASCKSCLPNCNTPTC